MRGAEIGTAAARDKLGTRCWSIRLSVDWDGREACSLSTGVAGLSVEGWCSAGWFLQAYATSSLLFIVARLLCSLAALMSPIGFTWEEMASGREATEWSG